MGHRGEISSVRMDASADNLSYFFNFKINRNNDLFLNLVVSIKQEEGFLRPFRRHSLVIFDEQLPLFYQKMDEALRAMREKRPYHSSFATDRGRSYTFFLRFRSGEQQLVCKEEKPSTSNFSQDLINIPYHLADDFQVALSKSFKEWRRLRQQQRPPVLSQESIHRIKVRKVVRAVRPDK